jgi:hypothetical protein
MPFNPCNLGTPRAILDVIEFRGTGAVCTHCKATVPRLLVIDDGNRSGPSIGCADCVERAGGPKRAMRRSSGENRG